MTAARLLTRPRGFVSSAKPKPEAYGMCVSVDGFDTRGKVVVNLVYAFDTEPFINMRKRRGKYRYRTLLRERLPERFAALIPRGGQDCGDHEWYLAEEQTWRCYHCRVGITHNVPWDERELEARRLEAAAMNIRAGVTAQQRLPVGHV